jgi:hypothetical protein
MRSKSETWELWQTIFAALTGDDETTKEETDDSSTDTDG